MSSWKKVRDEGDQVVYKFYTRVRKRTVKNHIKCFPSARDQRFKDWLREVDERAHGKKIRFNTAADAFIEHVKLNKTTAQGSYNIQHVTYAKTRFGNRYLDEIDVDDIETFRSAIIKKGKEKSTANRYITSLRSMWRWAIRKKYTNTNPTDIDQLKEENEKIVFLETEQVEELIAKATPYQKRWLMIAIFTGMRHAEIGRVKWCDVFFAGKVIRVYHTKTKRSRVIPMGDRLFAFLEAERKQFPNATHVVGEDVEIKSFKTSFSSLVRDIPWVKEKELTPHGFRHNYCCWAITTGMTLFELQQITGHRSVAALERYAHFMGDVSSEVVSKLERYMAGVKPRP